MSAGEKRRACRLRELLDAFEEQAAQGRFVDRVSSIPSEYVGMAAE